MGNRYIAVIPSFGHWLVLPTIVDDLIARGLPVIIVDDGNADEGRRTIEDLGAAREQVEVVRLAQNSGKGVAVYEGLKRASERGFTHALQIDADGQHDLSAIASLIKTAERYPEALVSGRPIFDVTIPKGRLIGRWITHVWVFIETLSFRIIDSMCGFRIYPLASTLAVFSAEPIGARMDFDTDIMVRMFWRGVAPVFVPVKVIYPPGNRSNFRVWQDNVLISWMHTRLVVLMVLRLPDVLRNRPPRIEGVRHWASQGERGARWGLRLTSLVSRFLGRRISAAFLLPVVAYFWATGRAHRLASEKYLRKVYGRPISLFDTFQHFFSFSMRALDAFRAWSGQVEKSSLCLRDEDLLFRAAADPRGALLIVSHHGNVEIARALLTEKLGGRLTSIVHTKHALNYNQIVARQSGDETSRMLQVTDFGPETAVLMQERIDRGEWIAIAGDRTPVGVDGRVAVVDFLGAPAPFPQGPWVLASLLHCPVYLLFCTKEDDSTWSLSFELISEDVRLPRASREEAILGLVGMYAKRLEQACRQAPLQWYNFFDFWDSGKRT
jgi:predicted LPLAT superfamily acyltransferase